MVERNTRSHKNYSKPVYFIFLLNLLEMVELMYGAKLPLYRNMVLIYMIHSEIRYEVQKILPKMKLNSKHYSIQCWPLFPANFLLSFGVVCIVDETF